MKLEDCKTAKELAEWIAALYLSLTPEKQKELIKGLKELYEEYLKRLSKSE